MIKKVLATAGLAAVAVGAWAPAASAVGDDRVSTQLGNHSEQSYGNTGTDEAETPLRTAEPARALLRALR
ncbi:MULTISPECIES: hypothetical protein [Streptomyces]|uniref:Uncharacterized protein n=2 Tax=Streptomyces TaxID=1883 RepID=A0A100Y966_9ACTN|nr:MULTISPECIES: hypothetical protein [Streptomyces]KUH39990.1 hypothetical protein ATE80_04135 [Streptomyces kanasensis]UUS29611.1 hypothetical protein NRO40_01340 [Streptomyces changanensis]